MKTLLLMFFTLTSVTAANASTGFSNGNNIDITLYSGWVRVTNCWDSIGPDTHFCEAADYNPGAFDRFVTDQKVDADRVELTAHHPDGSKKTKKKKYDSNKGLSKKFNLLISTLLQRPLLELGTNRVTYKLTKKRNEVARGEFEANVQIAGDLRCPNLTIPGWSDTCESATAACDRYFRQVSGCQ